MIISYLQKTVLLAFFFVFCGKGFSQNLFTNDKRAAYILYIARQVEWPDDKIGDEFTIAVFDTKDKLYNKINEKAKKTDSLKGRPIKILNFTSLSEIIPVNLVYIHHSSGVKLKDVKKQLENRSTLLISEGYEFEESMIMLVEADGRRAYTVNKEMIESEGLSISRLFVASAVKTRKQWEAESNNAKSLLSQQNKKVKEQRNEIAQQQEEIKQQQQNLRKLSKDIEEQQQKLKEKQEELKKHSREINEQKQILGSQQSEIKKQEEKINTQLAKIETQQLLIYVFIAFFLLILGMIFFIYRGYQIKKQANKLLAEKNDAITKQNIYISRQKEEIEKQRDEIKQQHEIAVKQRDQIGEQKQEITDSICYASRIQRAILPPETIIRDVMPEHFIFYKPRDIVSGDYYWIKDTDDKLIIVAADCTGHGVPGAFMSVLGMSLLNEIVIKKDEYKASQILDNLRRDVIKSLHQKGDNSDEAKDGMDLALCVIDKKTKVVNFAGAYNPLYIFRHKDNFDEFQKTKKFKIQEYDDYMLIEAKASRMPIGIYFKMRSFEDVDIQLKTDDTIYIFSDGYIDQFGGKEDNKLMAKNFKRLLSGMQHKTMEEQKHELDLFFEEWKGERPQLDDIIIIGIRF